MKVGILVFSLWLFPFVSQGQRITLTPIELNDHIRYEITNSIHTRIDTTSGVILSTKDTVNIIITKGYRVHPILFISYMDYKEKYFDTNWKPVKEMVLNFTPYKEEE